MRIFSPDQAEKKVENNMVKALELQQILVILMLRVKILFYSKTSKLADFRTQENTAICESIICFYLCYSNLSHHVWAQNKHF